MSQPNIYAITNVPPQVQAFALAKVSRSAGSCEDWIMTLNAEKSESFFDRYYKDNPYGHASIGDLGHVAIAIEGVSQWVAHALELPWFGPWDGQELSTRFSSFADKDCYCPDFNGNSEAEDLYHSIVSRLFALYNSIMDPMADWYRNRYPKPADWNDQRYESTVKARTFDVARYALPMAVKTAVMQVTSIRTLGRQISFCRSDELPEVRAVGDQLISAVKEPAFDVAREHLLRMDVKDLAPDCLDNDVKADFLPDSSFYGVMQSLKWGILEKILPPQSAAATLVRHVDPNPYLIQTRLKMRELALQYLPRFVPIHGSEHPTVSLHEIHRYTPVQQTVAALLHWQAPAGHSFSSVLRVVKNMSPADVSAVFRSGYELKTHYDHPLPMFNSGYSYVVDWHLDMGALRDIHRQRRNISFPQRPSVNEGYVIPRPLTDAKLDAHYVFIMNEIQRDIRRLECLAGHTPAIYAMPFAHMRSYAMFADLGQLDYITRLRANPNGRHFGYWKPAYDLSQQIVDTDPNNLRDFMGATSMDQFDFYNRG